MRDLILARLREISTSIGFDRFKPEYKLPDHITNSGTMKKHRWSWETRHSHLLQRDGWDKMTDEELLVFFERAIARSYQQR